MKKSMVIILCIILTMAITFPSAAFSVVTLKSIKLDKNAISLNVGQTYTLKMTLTPTNTTQKKLTFTTADKKIATVDINGKIAAIGAGKTVITVASAINKKIVAKATVTVLPKKKYKISWATMVYFAYDKDNLALKTLKQAFPDIDFDLIAIESSTFDEQMNTRVAAGDIPDIMYRGSITGVNSYAKQGILAELPEPLIAKNAPDYYKAIQEFGPEVFLACTYEGKNYGIPAMAPSNTRILCSAWRNDWLKNVGIGKVPETLTEMETAFTKFVNSDPDGNGKKDTYALTEAGKDKGIYLQIFDPIFEAFGVVAFQYVKDTDGKLRLGAVTDRGKQAVTLLNKWYKKGLIDPEFVTDDQAIIKQKYINGKTGYITTIYLDYVQRKDPINDGDIRKNARASNPDADTVMGYAPKGPQGKFGYASFGNISSSMVFGRQLAKDQDKFAKCLRVINKICASDLALNRKLTRGIEGVHYKFDENGKIEGIPPYDDPSKKGPLGTAFFSSIGVTPAFQDYYAPVEIKEDVKYSSARNVLDNKDYFTWMDLFSAPDTWSQVEGPYMQAGKSVIDFITGARPLTEWDQYVQEWETTGGVIQGKDYENAFKIGSAAMKAFQKK